MSSLAIALDRNQPNCQSGAGTGPEIPARTAMNADVQ
jgi:hypothetical protein